MSISTAAARMRCCLAVSVVMVTCSCSGNPQPNTTSARAASDPASAATASSPASPSVAATGDVLPDLVMLPLEAFHISYEKQQKVLRFSTDVMNIGNGPLDMTGIRASTLDPELKVTQNILQANGGQRKVKTTAVMRYSAADGHDHFHVQEYERYQLRPIAETTWRGSHKEGFCLRDDANLAGKRESRYENLDCGDNEKDEALQVREGQSEGWVDVYDWYLPGQYVELAGLSLPGDFCVAADVDPQHHLTEMTRDNNSTSTVVHITESEVTVVRQGC